MVYFHVLFAQANCVASGSEGQDSKKLISVTVQNSSTEIGLKEKFFKTYSEDYEMLMHR